MATGVLGKITTVVGAVFGTANERLLREMTPVADKVGALESAFQRKSDGELRGLSDGWREQLSGPKSFEEKQQILDRIMPEVFAAAREASRRVMITPSVDSPYPTMRPFDVQVIGAVALHRHMVAEMVTGEGKTLVATLAACLNGLTSDGVHIVTFNDHLAARDCRTMSPVYNFLGMTAGAIHANQSYEDKRVAYACDVTFGTNSEFGFDYLRDNMRYSPESQVQLTRGLHYAIVDEADSILIDEARTPLIISGPVTQQSDKFYMARRIAQALQPGKDYEAKEKEHEVRMNDEGIGRAEQMLKVPSLYTEETMEWPHFIETALRAKEFYQRDKAYIIKDGEVVIVDEFTGRLMEGRVWSDGLHQAVTVKEGLRLKDETQTVATITLQNFFRLYKKLGGMTGTAMTEAGEFDKIYKLGVVAIPTNLPLIRAAYTDRIYATEEGKWGGVLEEIADMHEGGRPVLVGTTSVEKSEYLSEKLLRSGIEHNVLNARPELAAREADVISGAGQAGAVTIATNMAGRGTDIVLGSGVAAAGGLHVVGTERHEARRIDNQLRGRAGRQGDPGSGRFYVSFQDDLMRIFAPESVRRWIGRTNAEDDVPIEMKMVGRWIAKAQRRVEEYNFEIRRNLLEYDEVMDEQRKSVYTWRQKFVEERDVEQELRVLIEDAVGDAVDLHVNPSVSADDWDVAELTAWSATTLGEEVELTDVARIGAQAVDGDMQKLARKAFDRRCEAVGKEPMLDFGRSLALRTIDMKWKDHLHAMDVLRSGIGLRSYAQLDPKIEYKSEGGEMFEQMLISIAEEITQLIFRVQVEERTERQVDDVWQVSGSRHDSLDADAYAHQQEQIADASGSHPVETIRIEARVGRNDPCPCGSGKKYKQCCGRG